MDKSFEGSKIALFVGDRLLVTLRDDYADIPFPGHWDLPGGGREAGEDPFQTLAREVYEEVALTLPPAAILWQRRYPASSGAGRFSWFFVGQIAAQAAQDIALGDEGQDWQLVSVAQFLTLRPVVPSFAPRLHDWVIDTGGLAGIAGAADFERQPYS